MIAHLLVSHKAAKGHAAPADAAHQAAGEAFATIPVDIVAVLDVHGNGLGAGADKRVLPRSAHGSVKARASSHVGGVVAVAEVDVDVDVDGGVGARVGEELLGGRGLLGRAKGGRPGICGRRWRGRCDVWVSAQCGGAAEAGAVSGRRRGGR